MSQETPVFRPLHVRPASRMYVRTPPVGTDRNVHDGEHLDTVNQLLLDHGVHQDTANQVLYEFTRLSKDVNILSGTRSIIIEWTDVDMVHHSVSLYTGFARVLLEAMVLCTPTPEICVQESGLPEYVYTDEQECFLRVAMKITEVYVRAYMYAQEWRVQRIRATTSSAFAGGRQRYADSDFTDVTGRTFTTVFTPLLARNVPTTSEGCGYVHVYEAKVEWRLEQVYMNVHRLNGIKERFLRTVYKMTFTCSQTGDKFYMYTQSLAVRQRMEAMAGKTFSAIANDELMYTGQTSSGAFGNAGEYEQEYTQSEVFLNPRTIIEARPEHQFSRMLKLFAMHIFQMVYRNTPSYDDFALVHRDYRRQQHGDDIPLYECLELYGGQLSIEEKLMIEALLVILVNDVTPCDVYNDALLSHGLPTVHERKFRRLRRNLYSKLNALLGRFDEKVSTEKLVVQKVDKLPLAPEIWQTEISFDNVYHMGEHNYTLIPRFCLPYYHKPSAEQKLPHWMVNAWTREEATQTEKPVQKLTGFIGCSRERRKPWRS